MWDSIYEFLFNPNHEMPVAAFIVIGIMSIILNTWVQKENERRRNNYNPTRNTTTTKKSSKKK